MSAKLPFEIKEIEAKGILSKCGIPGIDFVVNPYIGCRFGCKYCYASFMGRFVGKKVSDWGEYVYPKINAPELLAKEIERKLPNKGKGKEIFLSSVTDPYQGLEAKYRLTRRCLEVLADWEFAGTLSILTKSNLVTRDIDILKRFRQAVVGLTVTSADDGISRYFEKYAPSVSERFEALRKLNQAGLQTYAFIGPLLPHFVADEAGLEKVFQKLAEVGTKDVYVEHLNLSSYIRGRLMDEMKGTDKNIVAKFYSSQSKAYREDLEKLVKKLVEKYEMNLLLDLVIFHREFQAHHRD
ncbi:radical SAM protein [Candidatus Collierbacteria bacterium]|nr:radical SAM protein [Candidatus Collierbacteria bacterium]